MMRKIGFFPKVCKGSGAALLTLLLATAALAAVSMDDGGSVISNDGLNGVNMDGLEVHPWRAPEHAGEEILDGMPIYLSPEIYPMQPRLDPREPVVPYPQGPRLNLDDWQDDAFTPPGPVQGWKPGYDANKPLRP